MYTPQAKNRPADWWAALLTAVPAGVARRNHVVMELLYSPREGLDFSCRKVLLARRVIYPPPLFYKKLIFSLPFSKRLAYALLEIPR